MPADLKAMSAEQLAGTIRGMGITVSMDAALTELVARARRLSELERERDEAVASERRARQAMVDMRLRLNMAQELELGAREESASLKREIEEWKRRYRARVAGFDHCDAHEFYMADCRACTSADESANFFDENYA